MVIKKIENTSDEKGIVMNSKKKRQNRRELKGLFFILPSFIGACIFLIIPYMDVIRRSFTQSVTNTFVGLQNFSTIFSNSAFQMAAENTVRFAAVGIPILVVISLSTAVFLSDTTKNSNYLKNGFLIPMAIPVASIVLLWRVLFASKGLLNGLLYLFGIAGTDWMNTKYAFVVLVFIYVWKNLGYDIILWIAGLSAIPKDIYEAAKVDGAGRWKSFLYITLPNLWSTLFIITVLSMINSFKVFREAYLVVGDYPHESIYLLQHIFNNWFRDLDLDKMAAGAASMSVVMFVLILLFQRLWEREDA